MIKATKEIYIEEETELKPEHFAFLEHLEKNAGLYAITCKQLGVQRTVFFQWKNRLPEFAEKVDEINERMIEYVQSKLLENVRNNDIVAIKFWLKAKAKNQGFGDDTTLEINNIQPILNITVSDEETKNDLTKLLESGK